MSDTADNNRKYWDLLAPHYQEQTEISLDEFHYGPLLAGDKELGLLPESLGGLRCLELGCGAGQNSIVLAKRGAQCQAIDVSEQQVNIGRAFAVAEGVKVDFLAGDMEAFEGQDGGYDLIHSTYALPFAAEPAAFAKSIADALAPDGSALITTAHPLYAGEWLEVDIGEQGVLIEDYHDVFNDIRTINDFETNSVAKFHPIHEVAGWFTDAGLVIDRLLEPRPLPFDRVRSEAPYWSEDWLDQHAELTRIPIVLILRLKKI